MSIEDIVQLAQTIQVDVNDGDIGSHAERDLRGVDADDTAADDHNLGGRNTGHSAQQDAPSSAFMLKI